MTDDPQSLPAQSRSEQIIPSQIPRPVHIMDLEWLQEIAMKSNMDDKHRAQSIICRLAESEHRQLQLCRAVQSAIDNSIPTPSNRAESARRRL